MASRRPFPRNAPRNQALSGSGTIAGNALVSGQTVTGNLAYAVGASMLWGLSANTTANSPVASDQVVVGGALSLTGATGPSLSCDAAGSLVDWDDPF